MDDLSASGDYSHVMLQEDNPGPLWAHHQFVEEVNCYIQNWIDQAMRLELKKTTRVSKRGRIRTGASIVVYACTNSALVLVSLASKKGKAVVLIIV